MKIFKIAQGNNLYYHGSREIEKVPTPRDFPGVYFSPDPEDASRWGKNIAAYRINTQKLFKPNTTSTRIYQPDFDILERFIQSYGYIPPSSNFSKTWGNMGAAQKKINNLTEQDYYNVLSQVLLFPTKEWTSYLVELGYDGFINNADLFLINLSKAQYVGQYDVNRKTITQ